MADKTGGPAFPQPMATSAEGSMYVAAEKHPDFGGMTLRDYFAGQALVGYLASREYGEEAAQNPDKVAEWAYQNADAMIAAREASHD